MILFYGDPHGEWRPLYEAAAEMRPEAVIVLGDMDLDRPFEEAVAPVPAIGLPVFWIPGNHEGDRVDWHDFAFHSALAAANLHGRVVEIAGWRVAGLGGIFRRAVWYPRRASPDPAVADRASFLAKLAPKERWQGGLPLRHRVSIWPEDVATLARERADILVTHEAPSTMRRAGRPIGFRVLDDLAGQMGVSLVVHGHHHVDYGARLPSGIAVRGIGRASAWPLARRAPQANLSG